MARGQSGFSLLETILALVILSAALSGIYSWINTDLISLRRAEAVVASQNVLEEALRQVRLLRLVDGGEGSLDIDGYRIRWQASLVEPVTFGRGQRGPRAAYDFGLFSVDVTIETGGQSLGSWQTRVVQYDFVRPPPEALEALGA